MGCSRLGGSEEENRHSEHAVQTRGGRKGKEEGGSVGLEANGGTGSVEHGEKKGWRTQANSKKAL